MPRVLSCHVLDESHPKSTLLRSIGVKCSPQVYIHLGLVYMALFGNSIYTNIIKLS